MVYVSTNAIFSIFQSGDTVKFNFPVRIDQDQLKFLVKNANICSNSMAFVEHEGSPHQQQQMTRQPLLIKFAYSDILFLLVVDRFPINGSTFMILEPKVCTSSKSFDDPAVSAKRLGTDLSAMIQSLVLLNTSTKTTIEVAFVGMTSNKVKELGPSYKNGKLSQLTKDAMTKNLPLRKYGCTKTVIDTSLHEVCPLPHATPQGIAKIEDAHLEKLEDFLAPAGFDVSTTGLAISRLFDCHEFFDVLADITVAEFFQAQRDLLSNFRQEGDNQFPISQTDFEAITFPTDRNPEEFNQLHLLYTFLALHRYSDVQNMKDGVKHMCPTLARCPFNEMIDNKNDISDEELDLGQAATNYALKAAQDMFHFQVAQHDNATRLSLIDHINDVDIIREIISGFVPLTKRAIKGFSRFEKLLDEILDIHGQRTITQMYQVAAIYLVLNEVHPNQRNTFQNPEKDGHLQMVREVLEAANTKLATRFQIDIDNI